MKKVLIISFLIFTILLSLFCTSYAAVTVTKENLKEAFDKITSSEINEDTYTFSLENNFITITEDNNTYTLNYDLTDKPTFSSEIEIKKGMSYEEVEEKLDSINLYLPMFGYIATSIVQGSSLEDSAAHIITSLYKDVSITSSYVVIDDLHLSEGVTIEKKDDPYTFYTSEFGDRVIEYVNALYPNTTISDSETVNSYVMTIEKKELTETSCKLVSTLTVNTEADFSKLKGYYDNLEDPIISAAQNAAIQYNAMAEKENQMLQNYIDSLTNSNDKLPQTGNFFDLKDGLYLLFITSSIALIYIIFKATKYKNIDK